MSSTKVLGAPAPSCDVARTATHGGIGRDGGQVPSTVEDGSEEFLEGRGSRWGRGGQCSHSLRPQGNGRSNRPRLSRGAYPRCRSRTRREAIDDGLFDLEGQSVRHQQTRAKGRCVRRALREKGRQRSDVCRGPLRKLIEDLRLNLLLPMPSESHAPRYRIVVPGLRVARRGVDVRRSPSRVINVRAAANCTAPNVSLSNGPRVFALIACLFARARSASTRVDMSALFKSPAKTSSESPSSPSA